MGAVAAVVKHFAAYSLEVDYATNVDRHAFNASVSACAPSTPTQLFEMSRLVSTLDCNASASAFAPPAPMSLFCNLWRGRELHTNTRW